RRDRNVTGVQTCALPISLYVWLINRNLSIKTTRTKEGRIQNIWAVSCGNHNDAFIPINTVHFNKQLVQGLFTFIMSATKSSATLTSNSINPINTSNTWCILYRIFKQISYT